jgi:hypothetical protein
MVLLNRLHRKRIEFDLLPKSKLAVSITPNPLDRMFYRWMQNNCKKRFVVACLKMLRVGVLNWCKTMIINVSIYNYFKLIFFTCSGLSFLPLLIKEQNKFFSRKVLYFCKLKFFEIYFYFAKIAVINRITFYA